MKTIILHLNEDATKADILALASAGHFALTHENSKSPGDRMSVTMSDDMSKTFGVKFNQNSIAVWPPGVDNTET